MAALEVRSGGHGFFGGVLEIVGGEGVVAVVAEDAAKEGYESSVLGSGRFCYVADCARGECERASIPPGVQMGEVALSRTDVEVAEPAAYMLH